MWHGTYLHYVWLNLLLQDFQFYTFFFPVPADLKDGKIKALESHLFKCKSGFLLWVLKNPHGLDCHKIPNQVP